MLVLPETEVLRTDAALRSNRGGFSEDQAGSADRAAAEMDEVPVVGKAVLA